LGALCTPALALDVDAASIARNETNDERIRLSVEVFPSSFSLNDKFKLKATFDLPNRRRLFWPIGWGYPGLILWVWDDAGNGNPPPVFPPGPPPPPGMELEPKYFTAPDARAVSTSIDLPAAECFPKPGRHSISLRYYSPIPAGFPSVAGTVEMGDVAESARVPVTIH
jgi:hypothetical protein